MRGLLKNESNYDVQVLSLQGAPHLLTRSQIRRQVREPAIADAARVGLAARSCATCWPT